MDNVSAFITKAAYVMTEPIKVDRDGFLEFAINTGILIVDYRNFVIINGRRSVYYEALKALERGETIICTGENDKPVTSISKIHSDDIYAENLIEENGSAR
jgi:hypothetical protein